MVHKPPRLIPTQPQSSTTHADTIPLAALLSDVIRCIVDSDVYHQFRTDGPVRRCPVGIAWDHLLGIVCEPLVHTRLACRWGTEACTCQY